MQAELLKLIENFDVISFDVFDTLLLRPYLGQEDLWSDLGRRMETSENKHGDERWSKSFLKARIAADKETYAAATARGGEHTIAEAYARMPRRFARMQETEENLQRECLAVNPELMEVWKRAGELGKKRIIVSDMYLSEEWFAETLKDKGIGDYDALYVSSARQARKSTGKLFDVVRRDFPEDKILHIGDNAHSDVKMVEAAGFTTFKVDGPVEKFQRDFPFVREFLNEFPDVDTRRTVAAMALGWHRFCGGEAAVDYWTKLGFVQAGLLGVIYVRWIGRLAAELGIDTLWFVARDGYIWQRLCKILCPQLKTAYIYAPRSVLTCATCDLGRSPNVQKDRSALLAMRSKRDFGLSVDPVRILEVLKGKATSRRNREDEDLLEALRRLNEKTLTDYRGYLATLTDDLLRTAVVDGCSLEFSVQRLLKAATGRDIPAFYLASMAPMENAASLFATEGKTLRFQYLTEFLFGSPERPIADVNADGPVYGESLGDETFKESVSEAICRGAEACALALAGTTRLMSPSVWANWVEEFMRGMTEEDRVHLAKARNSTDIHHSYFENVTWTPQPKCRPIKRPWLARLRVRVRWNLRDGVSRFRLTLGRITLYGCAARLFVTMVNRLKI